MAEIVYPESLFTGLSLQLMLMRFEIQHAEKQGAGLAPQDMSGIFSVLCALDNRVIAAQKARGYSDAEPFERLDKEPWNKNVGRFQGPHEHPAQSHICVSHLFRRRRYRHRR